MPDTASVTAATSTADTGLSWGDLDWGNVPTWVSLVAALFAASVAGRNLWVDRKDRRQAQAGKVAGWWGSERHESELAAHPRLERLMVGSRYYFMHGALLRNASDLPVYDLRIEFVRDQKIVKVHSEHVLSPTATPTLFQPPDDADSDELSGKLDEGPYSIAVRFRDAAGRNWARSTDGRLKEHRKSSGSR